MGAMAKIEIYTSFLCGYCYRAKKLLDGKGVPYTEFELMADPARRQEMMQRAGGRSSVPQIFIDDEHIGGCEELYALEARGGLDPLLAN